MFKKNRNIILTVAVIFLFFILYRYVLLEPCSRLISSEPIVYNTTEYNFEVVDLSTYGLTGFGVERIDVQYGCIQEDNSSISGTFGSYNFIKTFDFSKLVYSWKVDGEFTGVEIQYGVSNSRSEQSNNVAFIIPLPKNVTCTVVPVYSAICG